MPTTRELNNPDLTLCPYGLHRDEEEDHCLCPKCIHSGDSCVKCDKCNERWHKRRAADPEYPTENYVIIWCDEFRRV